MIFCIQNIDGDDDDDFTKKKKIMKSLAVTYIKHTKRFKVKKL